jgi:hypothetical protein
MVLSEMLATVIVAERQRDTERRNREARLLHPDLEDVSRATRSVASELPVRAIRPGRASATGSACEPV